PMFRDGREHGERAARLSLAQRFERLPLRGRRPAVDQHELRAVTECAGPGPCSGQSDPEAVEFHVPVRALVNDPRVHAAAPAVRRRSVEAARAPPVAVALAEEVSGHPPRRDRDQDRPAEERAEDDKGRGPRRNRYGSSVVVEPPSPPDGAPVAASTAPARVTPSRRPADASMSAAAPASNAVRRAVRSPKRAMNRLTRPPWTAMFSAPTSVSDKPTSSGVQP